VVKPVTGVKLYPGERVDGGHSIRMASPEKGARKCSLVEVQVNRS